MIDYNKIILDNGLTAILHHDSTTPIVAVNTLYKVGSRNEAPDRTGFAHLFEHLMFGGSAHVSDFDKYVQLASGENNAFTNNDYTNYYITLPKDNIETALWLESDRMLSLNLNEHKLNIQKNVVVEEFKQNYLNRPYGDVWHLLRNLAYEVHPYKWPTIGLDVEHINSATLKQVEEFKAKYYNPANTILVIAGDIKPNEFEKLVKKWYQDIENLQAISNKELPKEPVQSSPKLLRVERNVPVSAIYKAYKMSNRYSKRFYLADFIADFISHGKSSPLYITLVDELGLFSQIDTYVTGDLDEGLFVIEGKLTPETSVDTANQAIEETLDNLFSNNIPDKDIQKVKNKIASALRFSKIGALNKAMNLAFYEFMGNINLINTLEDEYAMMTKADIVEEAQLLFNSNQCVTLMYCSQSS